MNTKKIDTPKVSSIKEFLARSIMIRNHMRDVKLQEALRWIQKLKPYVCNICGQIYGAEPYEVCNNIYALDTCVICKEFVCSQCSNSDRCIKCFPDRCRHCRISREKGYYRICSECNFPFCIACISHAGQWINDKVICPACTELRRNP